MSTLTSKSYLWLGNSDFVENCYIVHPIWCKIIHKCPKTKQTLKLHVSQSPLLKMNKPILSMHSIFNPNTTQSVPWQYGTPLNLSLITSNNILCHPYLFGFSDTSVLLSTKSDISDISESNLTWMLFTSWKLVI